MIIGYNHSTITIKNKEATQIVVKGITGNPLIYSFVDGVVNINTDNYDVGEYTYQLFKGDQVLLQDVIQIKQNLKYTTSSYNPKSQNQIILQALQATLAGRATSAQDFVKIGDKEIHYLAYDELLKWRDYYQKLVRKEQGKASTIRVEKVYYRQKI